MTILLILIYVVLAFGVGCMGYGRKIGFWTAFGIALLNVVIGLIAALYSKEEVEFIDIKKEEEI